jgi:hypothetical protein
MSHVRDLLPELPATRRGAPVRGSETAARIEGSRRHPLPRLLVQIFRGAFLAPSRTIGPASPLRDETGRLTTRKDPRQRRWRKPNDQTVHKSGASTRLRPATREQICSEAARCRRQHAVTGAGVGGPVEPRNQDNPHRISGSPAHDFHG